MKQKPQSEAVAPNREAPPEILCATIQVPLDYRKPGGKRIEVAISRIKATGTGKRREMSCSPTPEARADRGCTCPWAWPNGCPPPHGRSTSLDRRQPAAVEQHRRSYAV
ncbi:hypothetical protein SCALM49S_08127 [Streptomyces californicus]